MALTDEDKAWIAEHMEALRTELTERIEKTETTLLTEFHKWASPAELRQRSHAAAMRAFDAELEGVSERVTRLEKREPPAA
jgi:dienelactone hydrolase